MSKFRAGFLPSPGFYIFGGRAWTVSRTPDRAAANMESLRPIPLCLIGRMVMRLVWLFPIVHRARPVAAFGTETAPDRVLSRNSLPQSHLCQRLNSQVAIGAASEDIPSFSQARFPAEKPRSSETSPAGIRFASVQRPSGGLPVCSSIAGVQHVSTITEDRGNDSDR